MWSVKSAARRSADLPSRSGRWSGFLALKDTEIDARSISFFANGNNIIVVGDLCRRVVRCSLDAGIEHPETRQFKRNPKQEILADRGKHIAACLTVCRAYAVAKRPNLLPQLASYGEWSDTVRSALVWLGEADPVKSQGKAHADDPEASALLTVLNEWSRRIGAGEANARACATVIVLCDKNSTNARTAWEGIRSHQTARCGAGRDADETQPQARCDSFGLLAAFQEEPADRKDAVQEQAGDRA